MVTATTARKRIVERDSELIARPPRPWSVVVALLELARQRVRVLVHVPPVEPGDEERGGELQQPEDQGDVDVADDLGAHEVVGPVRHDDVEQVPGHERDGRGEHEAAEPLAQLHELGRLRGAPS